MQTETKTITTPNGTSVELKGWLSGRDQREFRKVLVSLSELSKADSLEQIENIVITTVVLSINGSTEDVLNAALNLPSEDYSFIVNECNDVIKGLTVEKKTTSTGNTDNGSEEKQ